MIPPPELTPGDTLISTLRHGLTELNREQRVGGRLDVPLIKQGRRQAEAASETFEGTDFDVVISSPLKRAIETALIVTGASAEQIVLEPLCVERSFGEMEGLTRAQVEEQFPQIVYLQIDHIGYSLNPPGGESFDALRQRAEQFLDRLLSRYAGQRIIVSSHQNFLQQLHGHMQGRDPYDSLRTDLLNLEFNQFHLAPDRSLRGHRKLLLSTDADQYASF